MRNGNGAARNDSTRVGGSVPRRSRAGGSRKVPARYWTTASSSSALNDAIRAHRRGNLQLALQHYGERLREAPECVDAWINAGSAETRLGRARAAISSFDRALGLLEAGTVPAEVRARAFRDIALGLMTVGELEPGRDALRRAVQADPGLLGAWLHLARLELETGERQRAIAAARAAAALENEGASALLELARVAFDHADRAESITALRAAMARKPAPPLAELWLLLVGHDPTSPDITLLRTLSELATREPSIASEVDAACHVVSHMKGVRWFSSARETLRFAAAVAPEGGATVELGVHHGVSLRWLSECRGGVLHGFDSFEGLPDAWAGVPRGRFTADGQTPLGLACELWVGWFDDQLPRFVARHPEPISLLHVDSDLYESAVSGFLHLAPLLVPGTVIVFDEYLGHATWRQDEFRAFAEACARQRWAFEHLAVNPFTGQAVVRLV